MARINCTVQLTFGHLWVLGDLDDDLESEPARRGVHELTDPDAHIHGFLAIEINGRRLAHLDFDPNGVCIGEWSFQLQSALETLKEADESKFVFDEGEQGQPAFLFEREGDRLLISVIASDLGGGSAEPEWQRIACPFIDFEEGVGHRDRAEQTEFAARRREVRRTPLRPAV